MQKVSYETELAELENQYARIRNSDLSALQQLVANVSAGPAIFVGTGGTMAVAKFAAYLHTRAAGQPAQVATPLEMSLLDIDPNRATVFFSSGLKHPDALHVLKQLGKGKFRPSGVVTFRDVVEFQSKLQPGVVAVSLPPLLFREGFLAATSVFSMVAALVVAYLGEEALPADFPEPDIQYPEESERLLVLTDPSLAAVGIDIETRFEELGLAAVQVTDFRNFAHGRHVGLARNQDRTSVLTLATPGIEPLAEATATILRSAGVEVTSWTSKTDGPFATVELLVASLRMAGKFASSQRVNIARPGASEFGRRLYHLKPDRLIPRFDIGPVERKFHAAGVGPFSEASRNAYSLAFDEWFKVLSNTLFSGLVLDYDGTVIEASLREEMPSAEIQGSLKRLLGEGLPISFASGRGKSIYKDLQKWVPKEFWNGVQVGLYNGGVILNLTENLPEVHDPDSVIREVVQKIKDMPFADRLAIEPRECQVTVTVRSGFYAELHQLGRLLESVISAGIAPDFKIQVSGHSIDIVPHASTKKNVVEKLEAHSGGPVLVIGDQGGVNGNDYEMLAYRDSTLSVDVCSFDPTRCWNLDTKGLYGPDLLSEYLKAIKKADGGFRFIWSAK